jgi:methylthioribose-1-phosphate isomerase
LLKTGRFYSFSEKENLLAMHIPAVKYTPYKLKIINQSVLPYSFTYIQISSLEDCYQAIKNLKVRGAPLIGIVAAYSIVICAYHLSKKNSSAEFIDQLEISLEYLKSSRPTAVNLAWALSRMQMVYTSLCRENPKSIVSALSAEAEKIHREDYESCRKIGLNGLKILPDKANILTHCNTGSLATGGWGTALGVVYAAKEKDLDIHVYVDETRPLGQGARLTLWELMQNKVPCTLITDSMAASLMQDRKIDLVIFGADRITRNGDVANKIGSYALAVLAKAHKIPCYAAAPVSTFDLSLQSGDKIPIEQRDAQEILQFYKYDRNIFKIIKVYNPAFDVTPGRFLTGIITERGILGHPLEESITKLLT